jgi:hypothetical protein
VCVRARVATSPFLEQWTDFHERHTIGKQFQPRIFLLFSTLGNNNMADARTCDVEATLAPLNLV